MAVKSEGRSAFALTVSKQYGAWSILLACFIMGALVGGNWNPRILLLLPAVLFGYLARSAAGVFLRLSRKDERRGVAAWTIAYTLIVLLAGGSLVILYDLWTLLPLGVVILAFGLATVVLSQRRMETTTGGELVGMIGLTLVAPAAEYVSSGLFSSRTLGLWLLSAFFFCGSIFHVRYLVRRRADSTGPPKLRIRAGWPSVVYQVAVLCVSLVLALRGTLPPFSPAALLPSSLWAWVAVGVRLRKPMQVRRIGIIEIVNTIVFLVLIVLAFHFS
jgi:hypothetical protein